MGCGAAYAAAMLWAEIKEILSCSYMEKQRECEILGWESRVGCSVSLGNSHGRGHGHFLLLAIQ